MRRLLAGLLATVACLSVYPEGPAEDPSNCELVLKNGSRIRGVLKGPKEITIATKAGKKTLALVSIWTARWGSVKDEEHDAVVTEDGALRGWIAEMDPVEVDTGFGSVKVPTDSLVSLRMLGGDRAFSADFEGAELGGWTAKGTSKWTTDGGKLTGTPGGGGDWLLFDEPFDGKYTLEVEMACDDWAAIVWNASDAGSATAFWIYPGTAGVWGNGNWTSTPVARWNAAVTAGKAVKVKLEIDGGSVKCWLDGAYLGETTAQGESGKVGFGVWTKPATWDNLKISR